MYLIKKMYDNVTNVTSIKWRGLQARMMTCGERESINPLPPLPAFSSLVVDGGGAAGGGGRNTERATARLIIQVAHYIGSIVPPII